MMVEKATALVTAQNLMERALELLDMTGQDYPALHLQMALDVLTDAPVARTIEEADAMLDTPEGRVLLGRILDRRHDEPSPEAAQRAASLVRLHKDKTLGRAADFPPGRAPEGYRAPTAR